jgi:hypothetical protein
MQKRKNLMEVAFDFNKETFDERDLGAIEDCRKRVIDNMSRKKEETFVAYRYNEDKNGKMTSIEFYVISGIDLLAVKNSDIE